mmetsp:Transcript_41141/g.85900  ORF Transcript_41141/g.85900 Transcript_41141/m.85900 type:complete len:400 (+) Transcript_41141:328-1527(+)
MGRRAVWQARAPDPGLPLRPIRRHRAAALRRTHVRPGKGPQPFPHQRRHRHGVRQQRLRPARHRAGPRRPLHPHPHQRPQRRQGHLHRLLPLHGAQQRGQPVRVGERLVGQARPRLRRQLRHPPPRLRAQECPHPLRRVRRPPHRRHHRRRRRVDLGQGAPRAARPQLRQGGVQPAHVRDAAEARGGAGALRGEPHPRLPAQRPRLRLRRQLPRPARPPRLCRPGGADDNCAGGVRQGPGVGHGVRADLLHGARRLGRRLHLRERVQGAADRASRRAAAVRRAAARGPGHLHRLRRLHHDRHRRLGQLLPVVRQGRVVAYGAAGAVPRHQGGRAGLLRRGALCVRVHDGHGLHAGHDHAGPRVDGVERDHDGEHAQAARRAGDYAAPREPRDPGQHHGQ